MESKVLGYSFVLLVLVVFSPESKGLNGIAKVSPLPGGRRRSFQKGDPKAEWSKDDLEDFATKRQLCDAAKRMGC